MKFIKISILFIVVAMSVFGCDKEAQKEKAADSANSSTESVIESEISGEESTDDSSESPKPLSVADNMVIDIDSEEEIFGD